VASVDEPTKGWSSSAMRAGCMGKSDCRQKAGAREQCRWSGARGE
jgi:hypothetical protein